MFRQNFGQIVPKNVLVNRGYTLGQYSGACGPAGGGGCWSDFSPLILKLLLGRLAPTQLISKDIIMFKLHVGVCVATPTNWATPNPQGHAPMP